MSSIVIPVKSDRQVVAEEIEAWIQDHSDTFDAPYGVVSSIDRVASGGKVRTVTFGIARTLDASIQVWSPTRIRVWGRGPASIRFREVPNSTFVSVQDFKDRMTALFLRNDRRG